MRRRSSVRLDAASSCWACSNRALASARRAFASTSWALVVPSAFLLAASRRDASTVVTPKAMKPPQVSAWTTANVRTPSWTPSTTPMTTAWATTSAAALRSPMMWSAAHAVMIGSARAKP
jgi:hypothetical protein